MVIRRSTLTRLSSQRPIGHLCTHSPCLSHWPLSLSIGLCALRHQQGGLAFKCFPFFCWMNERIRAKRCAWDVVVVEWCTWRRFVYYECVPIRSGGRGRGLLYSICNLKLCVYARQDIGWTRCNPLQQVIDKSRLFMPVVKLKKKGVHVGDGRHRA